MAFIQGGPLDGSNREGHPADLRILVLHRAATGTECDTYIRDEPGGEFIWRHAGPKREDDWEWRFTSSPQDTAKPS